MNSCIYEGRVQHRRFSPVQHSFRYNLFMMYLDLDELPDLFQKRWFWSTTHFNLAWFRRKDHMGETHIPLSEAVRNLVLRESGVQLQGPIRLLTHLRYFGYGFNPVSFYFCYDRSGKKVETIVAEVNNTPWGEQHCYVLGKEKDDMPDSKKEFRFNKAFHISPFMEMDLQYRWLFKEPGDRLFSHMENLKDGKKIFDASLRLSRQEMSQWNLARVLTQYPLMTIKVISGIYVQALRLWLKNCPFYIHPRKEASYKAAQHHETKKSI